MTDFGVVLLDQHCRNALCVPKRATFPNYHNHSATNIQLFCSEDGYITSTIPSVSTLRHVKHDSNLIFLKVKNHSGASNVTND
jgi:patatin-like phospholipase/acyl hydrolase